VTDLSPLCGMKLGSLACGGTRVLDLSPLKGMMLTQIAFRRTEVSDISPLHGMPLTYLYFNGSSVNDLSPLKGMPLKQLYCDLKLSRDSEVLRSITTLETIQDKPAAEFWKDVEAQQAAFDAWTKQVAAMPADEQVKAVARKLQELNPGFDGTVTPTIDGDVVTGLQFLSDDVTDISPVRALAGLTDLTVAGSQPVARSSPPKSKLADLSPLKGTRLTRLVCSFSQVADLTPLQGMPLTWLICNSTEIRDLSPLHGMPLQGLYCSLTRISDIAPLKGMPLTAFACYATEVSDLTPLKGMELTGVDLGETPVADLTPLKGMPVSFLSVHLTTHLAELSALGGMPLKTLYCDVKPDRDIELLRSIKTLETINGKPAAEFWKEFDQQQKGTKP